jgi:hypothetical protein
MKLNLTLDEFVMLAEVALKTEYFIKEMNIDIEEKYKEYLLDTICENGNGVFLNEKYTNEQYDLLWKKIQTAKE